MSTAVFYHGLGFATYSAVVARTAPTALVAVIIATRDRPAQLARCLSALDGQRFAGRLEVVVVDDDPRQVLSREDLPAVRHPVRVVPGRGAGPAAARNAGVAASRADLVLFTDDDAEPAATWVACAVGALQADGVVCVEGPVTTPPYDHLRQYSIATSVPGSFWTCNVGYTREVLDRVGGFDEAAFPRYREDLDLGYRALADGRSAYARGMSVVHHPRDVGPWGRYRLVAAGIADIELERRHPDRVSYLSRAPHALRPLAQVLRRAAADGRRELRRPRPRRLARWGANTTAEVFAGLRLVPPRLAARRGGKRV